MNKPFAKKEAPLSYAEGPRLQRVLEELAFDDQVRFVESYRAHLESPTIQSLQRRGHLLYVTIDDGVQVYDLGAAARAQSFLTALTDCLRTQNALVPVLMPEPAPQTN